MKDPMIKGCQSSNKLFFFTKVLLSDGGKSRVFGTLFSIKTATSRIEFFLRKVGCR